MFVLKENELNYETRIEKRKEQRIQVDIQIDKDPYKNCDRK